MKKILYILLLFSIGLSAQIPGAAGDGTTDDTAAIQAELNGGGTVNFSASTTYRITSQIVINVSGNQTINGNGSTLVMTSGYLDDEMVYVNKASGTAFIDDLNLDANGAYARGGYEFRSSFELTNSTIQGMYMPTGNTNTAIGINIFGFLGKAWSNALIEDVSVLDITAISSDCSVANVSDGSSKGIQANMGVSGYTNMSNSMTLRRVTIDGVWGDDADGLDIYLFTNQDTYTGTILIEDSTITNCARRLTKVTSSNITYNNVTFTATNPANGNLQGCPTSGMMQMFTPSYTGGKPFLRDVTVRECTFDRTGGFFFSGIVSSYTQDVTIEGSTFINGRVAFTGVWGDFYIIGNTFDDDSILLNYSSPAEWDTGAGLCETNNTTGASWNQLYSNGTPPTCPVSCYNGIKDGDETGVDTGGSCTTTPHISAASTYPTSDKLLAAGTRQLYVEIVPTNATDPSGTWSTSNAAVATVGSTTGLVTGVGVGTCTITWTATDTTGGSITDTTTIEVESSSTEDSIMVLKPQGYYTPTSGDADSWDDTSGFELHGTEVGTITFTDEASFDGSSYYDLPDSQFLDYTPGTDEFTIIYREGDTAPTTSGYGISKRTATEEQYAAFTYSGGTLNNFFAGGATEQAVNVTQANNRLVILVVTTTNVNAWIDGEQVVTNSTALGTETASGQSANIGGRTDGSYLLNSGATLDLVSTIPKAINTSERQAIESEFQVNGAAASNSTKPASALDKPVFYSGTTKKLLPQN